MFQKQREIRWLLMTRKEKAVELFFTVLYWPVMLILLIVAAVLVVKAQGGRNHPGDVTGVICWQGQH